MLRTRLLSLTLFAGLGGSTAFGGLFEDIYRGMDILSTPSGGPLLQTGDGTRVNGQRSGRLRIVPEQFGKGYTLEFDRSFGPDSRGRPEVLDLGAVELELAGATQATMGYTRRGFLVGNADVTMNNLSYSVRGKTGAQDAELRGTFNLNQSLEVNQFGFYSLTLNASNTNSQFLLDGVLAQNQKDANFDIGPIVVKGNIFYDGVLSLLSAYGVNTDGLAQTTPKSPIDRIADAIQQQALVAGIQLADGTTTGLIDTAALTMIAGEQVSSSLEVSQDAPARGNQTVPEPSTLVLVGLGSLALYRTRRR